MKRTFFTITILFAGLFGGFVLAQKDDPNYSAVDTIIDPNYYLGLTKADVTIGAGTDVGQRYPIYAYFGYSYTQTIYLQTELGAAGNITHIKYYFAGTNLSNSNTWTIYMGNTSKSMFTSLTDWVPLASMTQVYSGTFADPGAPGWITFDITDFPYNGIGNLVIAVHENAPGLNNSSDRFYCSTVADTRSMVYFSDNIDATPATPQSAGYYQAFIPNTILTIIAGVAPDITTQPVDATVCKNETVVLSVVATNATSYQWYKDLFPLSDYGNVSGTSTANLTMSNVTSMDNGVYYCAVENSGIIENSDNATVLVNPLPVVSFSGLNSFYCVYNDSTTLIGSPAGGSFSGNGVIGNMFDPSIAGVGVYDIVYFYTDGNGCENSDTLSVTVDPCAGIDTQNLPSVSVYPNPSDASFELLLPAENCNIRIINSLGYIVSEFSSENQPHITIDLGTKATGIYYICVEVNGSVNYLKLMIE